MKVDITTAYTHPQKYKGLKYDTPTNQEINKAYVELNCLKCTKFCGQEHDFSECVDRNGNRLCFDRVKMPSLIQPEVRCKTEGEL